MKPSLLPCLLLGAAVALGAPAARGADPVLDPPPAAALDEKNADFRDDLARAMKRYLAGAPWGPYYRSANPHHRIYFHQPYETVLSLSRALPYLPEPDRASVLASLDDFVKKYDPLERASVLEQAWGGGPVADLGDTAKSGRWRGYSAPPPATNGPSYNFWPAPEVPAFALYAVWAYAHHGDRKAYVEQHWQDIQSLYAKSKGTPAGAELWALTGAMIGAARLAVMHGDTAMATEAAGFAAAGLAAAHAFKAHAEAWDEHRRVQTFALPLTGYDRTLASEEPRPISRALAREVLDSIGSDAKARAEIKEHVEHYVHRNDYTFGGNPLIITELVDWSATEHGGFSGSEGGALLPEVAWGFFLTHAYALGTNQDTLRPLLDVGWCRADLMYLDKLVAAIEAVPGSGAPPPPDWDAGTGNDDGGTDRPDGGPGSSPSKEGGCGCQLPGESPANPWWAVGLFGAVVALYRRR